MANPMQARSQGQNLSELVDSTMAELGGVFEVMGWAEDEIAKAIRRHPSQRDALFHAFTLIKPRDDLGFGMGTEFVVRSHMAELLERVAVGGDTRPPTAAEMCLICGRASLAAPVHGAAAGLYFRLWLKAFPNHPLTKEHLRHQAHYERLHGNRIDDLASELAARAGAPDRRMTDVDCRGWHHGERVTCRYASRTHGGHEARGSGHPGRKRIASMRNR